MNTIEVIECQFCGDSCGEDICYSCQDTAEWFGIDTDELYDMI